MSRRGGTALSVRPFARSPGRRVTRPGCQAARRTPSTSATTSGSCSQASSAAGRGGSPAVRGSLPVRGEEPLQLVEPHHHRPIQQPVPMVVVAAAACAAGWRSPRLLPTPPNCSSTGLDTAGRARHADGRGLQATQRRREALRKLAEWLSEKPGREAEIEQHFRDAAATGDPYARCTS
jgi:hypothetical protein